MDPSMQWAQPSAPAGSTEMDMEDTPAQANIQEVPPQDFHDQIQHTPAAPQHNSVGDAAFQGSKAEAEPAGHKDAMQAVQTQFEEQVHHPEPLSADAAAATADVPMPVVAQGADHGQQGNEQQQETPVNAEAPQLSFGQDWQQQDASAQMEVDEAAPAVAAPSKSWEAGDQDQAVRPADGAPLENAAAAASHALPAAERPIQAPSSDLKEAPAVNRPIQAASSEPMGAPAADHPIQTPSSEPDQTMAEHPVQAPSSAPAQTTHVAAAAGDEPQGSGAAVEQQHNVEFEQAHVGVGNTPLAHVRTDGMGLDQGGEVSAQEAAPGGEGGLQLHGKAPAVATSGAAGPAGTGTPRGSVGIASGGRRHAEIKPETDAGAVVWAKTPRYPWWPAQVLAREDPWIPADMEAPRRGAVPVRFFGTYNFAWIESQRALGPWGDGVKDERAAKGKVKAFQDALNEAEHFLATGETPRGFEMGLVPEGGDAPEDGAGAGGSGGHPRNKPRDGKGVSKKDGKSAGLKRREADKAAAAARASAQRKLKAMRKLGLAPPRGSPYGGEPCLDAARNWVGVLQRSLAAEAQRAEARAAAAAAQMRAHEQQVLQHQLMQRKLQEQHVHQLYMEAQRRQHQFLQQQQAQQKQQQQGGQAPVSSLGQTQVPTQVGSVVRPSPAVQQLPISSPAQAAFVNRPAFTPPAASVVQTGAPSQAAMNQVMLGVRPGLAQTGQAPTPQRPLQPAGLGGPALPLNRGVPAGIMPNLAAAQPNAAAHSNLAHTLQQLRVMQQQHARSPQVPNMAPVFRPNPPAVSPAVPSGGHPAQQPGNQLPSGGHHAQQPGDHPPSAVQNASGEGARSQGKPPPQLINS